MLFLIMAYALLERISIIRSGKLFGFSDANFASFITQKIPFQMYILEWKIVCVYGRRFVGDFRHPKNSISNAYTFLDFWDLILDCNIRF